MDDLGFQPLIPASLWLALVIVAAALLAWYGLRRPLGVARSRWALMVALMTGAIVLVLLLLLNPTWTHEIRPPGNKPVLTVLVDASASMATPDAGNGQTRYTAADAIAADLAKSLNNQFDVHIETFDRSVKNIDAAQLASVHPTGGSTDLGAAIRSALTGEQAQGQAVVLLSDGINNTGSVARILESARVAKSLSCPIFTCTLGGDVHSNDVAIELQSAQDMAIVGQKLPLTAQLTHPRNMSGRASVSLLLDGKDVDHRDVLLDASGETSVHFLITQDAVGVYPYEVRVDPFPGETNLANNAASYVLRVVNEPIHVLVLEGKPYWDSKFFTRTLSADAAVAMDEVVKISDKRFLWRNLTHSTGPGSKSQPLVETWKITADPKAPLASADRLKGYQIVVLGRDAEVFLDDTAIANIQTWVSQQGGSLVCYRGSPTEQHDPRLDKLLPVRWSAASATAPRFHMSLTPQGRDLNWFRGDSVDTDAPLVGLPSLATADVVDASKPLAVVLATSTAPDGTKSPAVIYYPYGQGRVVTVEGAGMWRWAFLPPKYQEQEQLYASLWHSMMRWLTSGLNLKPGQIVNLRADKIRFGSDEPATATLLAHEASGAAKAPNVQLTAATGSASPRTFAPTPIGSQAGVFRINFGILPEGRYQAVVEGAKPDDPSARIIFDVHPYNLEEVQLQARPDLMARIAHDSGGGAINTRDTASDLTRQFTQTMARVHPPMIERTAAWDRWWILLGVLTLWSISWAVRRTGGLI